MIYAVTSMILAGKWFKVVGIIYVEIHMIYKVSTTIYAVTGMILAEKNISTVNGMISMKK